MTEEYQPSLIEETKTSFDSIYFYFVILFNDSIHEFSYVEDCLMKICFKTKKEAKKIAMDAHTNGKAVCFQGSMEECETVAENMTNANLTVILGV
ncbi:ATP-dependent Clp protease adaptor ClpS [Leptospira sp. 2 VSF19]|uniref:ATP-dependent Clp protease adaptor ClpS n=1 Tax=Leptospira soteropolitanensis TaxID=2950025 RepID=A0AAW5VNR0_9LEPT|nr:ATP-dependent Clp protease adaptor ClpS [Leptospira soteropolitanensis]MCW7493665.1 ATP-dependent Clp protease adaptor ClpS [Leptospira soteropolitanensis]MCW7501263.1 ATP-dependent Clp protease adaptor ClpS [Leptospira soteropolitanensis]MCW7523551.1 ATP-dependent Clp protease adaptor ClpS [Leptospira soteropolitanensis]MCW7527377.1 ATP-dependent Clp protease adaptor ClpS [Leptospira soteropolitanensis]MCW7531233.1 ATP-dependent Clp protease adaptor ClpS [Leptospira soteropolitanensis]